MSILNQILGRANKAPVPVPTPEWPELDGQLFVRRLAATERVEFYAAAHKLDALGGAAFEAMVAAYCTVLADGSRAFDDGDCQALAADPGSGSAIERLSDSADELNVLSSRAREALKKTCETTQRSAPTSGSQDKPESA
jgi:hypothetical protein